MERFTLKNLSPGWSQALDVAMWTILWIMAVVASAAGTYGSLLTCWGGCPAGVDWYRIMFYTSLCALVSGPLIIAILAYRRRLRRTATVYLALGILLAATWLVLAANHAGWRPGIG
jgi:hypothetical protein